MLYTDHSKDRGVGGRTVLEWILGNMVGRCGLDLFGPGQGKVASSREHGNEPMGSVRSGVFRD
jgi:hypothetical protein